MFYLVNYLSQRPCQYLFLRVHGAGFGFPSNSPISTLILIEVDRVTV